jgi:hypothetical protein
MHECARARRAFKFADDYEDKAGWHNLGRATL